MPIAVSADQIELLWTRLAIEVNLPHGSASNSLAHPLSLKGTAQLWVVPRAVGGNVSALRLHCRQCEITAVTVNGKEADWDLQDPHAEIVRNPSMFGDGDALDVFQRASFMAAAEGELTVTLPHACNNFETPNETSAAHTGSPVPDSEAWARASRSHALMHMRAQVASARADCYLIEVEYNLEKPRGGFRTMRSSTGEAVLYTSGGGACGSCVGVDYDGARCRWPCLDGPHSHHQAPIDLIITSSAEHTVLASGQLVKRSQSEPPRWIQEHGVTGVFATSEWFLGPHCPLRGLGFALGASLQLFSSIGSSSAAADHTNTENAQAADGGLEHPTIDQWVVAGEEALSSERVGHAVSGLDAAALFIGDLLGADFPAPTHSQVWLPCDREGALPHDTLVFANLTFVSARLAVGLRHADPQLPSHLTQLRAALLSWLLPLLKLRHAAADGWLAPGLAGWLVLCWVERTLGYDTRRLALQRLHDSVVARERGCADVLPVSRGASFAAGRPVVAGCAAATEDPLLLGLRALKSDDLLGVNAKATLVIHMMEHRLGVLGRDAIIRAAHLAIAPALDLLAPPLELALSSASSTVGDSDGSQKVSSASQDGGSAATAAPLAPLTEASVLCSKSFFALVNGDDDAVAAASGERPDTFAASTRDSNPGATSWMAQWVYGSGVACLLCEWEWDKGKNEVQVTLKQVVPEGRSNDPAEAAGSAHQGAFQGPILIRVVEVDEVVIDHRRVLGSELLSKFTLKCQTSIKASRSRSFMGGEEATSECPVLWIKVDPDYCWAREVVMRRQPFDSWLEQLGKDGDADARVNALRAIAEHPAPDEPHKLRKPAAALLADVVRGTLLPLPGGDVAVEEHSWVVRAEAVDALARWQAMHAPRTGVANLAGSWAGWEGLSRSLADLFLDKDSDTPLPLGTRVVRCSTALPLLSGEDGGEFGDGGDDGDSGGGGRNAGGVQTQQSCFASANLHVCLLEAIASVRAKNGASPLAGAKALLQALRHLDDDHVAPTATSTEQAASSASALALGGDGSSKKRRRAEHEVMGKTAMDTGYSIARVLAAVGEVVLFPEEVHSDAETWRQSALSQAARLLRADQGFRRSHNSIVSAAALQAIASLTVQASSASSTSSPETSADLYLRPWGERCYPDSVRLVALVGTVQQHAASGNALVVLDALSWFLTQLFGSGSSSEKAAPSSDWLRLRALTALTEWLSGSAGPGGVLGNEGQLLFNDQWMPGLAGLSPAAALSKSFYSPGSAALKPSIRQQQLARQCRELVRGAVGFSSSSSLPPNQSDALEEVQPAAQAFCTRLWTLASSSLITCYDQPVRGALRDLWTTLLAYDVPPCLRQGATEGGQADGGAAMLLRPNRIPGWAESPAVQVLLAHARRVRKLDRRRAAGGSWLDEKRDEGSSHPKPRLRLVVNPNSAAPSAPGM